MIYGISVVRTPLDRLEALLRAELNLASKTLPVLAKGPWGSSASVWALTPTKKNYPTTSTRVTAQTRLRSNTTNTMPPSPNVWIAASDGDIAAVGQFLLRDPTAVNSHDENGCEYPPHSYPFINGIFLLQCYNYLRSLLRNGNEIKKKTPQSMLPYPTTTSRC